jgi:hypothetical protein
MSETQEATIDDREMDPVRAQQVAWVKAKLGIDVPLTRPRANAMVGGKPPPVPPKSIGQSNGEGPVIGQQRDPAGAFNRRLNAALADLQTIRALPAASDKAETAKANLEKALAAMASAAKVKDFDTADTQLTAAQDDAKIISDEMSAAKGKFDTAFDPLAAKLDASVARTKGVAGLDAKVTASEKAALDLRAAAEKAAEGLEFKTALAGVPPLANAIKTLEVEYLAAANAADTAVTNALAELTAQVTHVEDVQLNSTVTKAAQTKATKDHAAAMSKATPEERIVALLAVNIEADQAIAAAKDMVKGKANTGSAAGSTELRDNAARAITALAQGDPKQALQTRLDAWDKQKLAANAERDLDKQQTALVKLDEAAHKLLDDALAAAGGDVAAKKQAAYKAALEKRYGVTITIPPGMTNTHLDQMYDMFALLPVEHTGTDKMKKITYNKEEGAAYDKAEIFMGDYGDGKGTWDYKEPQNAFNISTLHEIGHSVDDKYGLMANNSAANCGGWKAETLASVKQVFVGSYNGAPFADLPALVELALTKGAIEGVNPDGSKWKAVTKFTDADRPGGLANPDWQKILTILNQCVKIRSDNWPWGKNNTVQFSTRNYHESYDGQWVSYLAASRDRAKEVRDYQWRAPGEWFAELYAWSWLKKEAAPAGIDKKVASYMWTAKT